MTFVPGPTIIGAWLICTAWLSLFAAAAIQAPRRYTAGDTVRDPRFRDWLAVAAVIWLLLQAAAALVLLALA